MPIRIPVQTIAPIRPVNPINKDTQKFNLLNFFLFFLIIEKESFDLAFFFNITAHITPETLSAIPNRIIQTKIILLIGNSGFELAKRIKLFIILL